MLILIIILVAAVLYLIAGASIGLRNAKFFEETIKRMENEQMDPDFIRGYKFGYFKITMIDGPFIYLKTFLGLDR